MWEAVEKMILNPKTVIGDCLETAFGLPIYVEIICRAKNGGQFADEDFRKKYNAYYRVRQRKPEWYAEYYRLMESQHSTNKSFEELLRALLPYGGIEVSFSSKLLSTIDTNRPIWDQYVLKSLGRFDEWTSFSQRPCEERIKKAVSLYAEIEQWYVDFLNTQTGKECIKQFDTVLPQYADIISATKKIDYMLVSKR